jgi:hypothetical protein
MASPSLPSVFLCDSDSSVKSGRGEDVASMTDDSGSKQSSSTEYNKNAKSSIQDVLGNRETRRLLTIKIMFGLVITAFAVMASVWVYKAVSKNEIQSFETNFEDRALKILDAFKSNFETGVQAIDSLAIQHTSYARDSEWPLVTLPDFDIRGASATELSKGATLALVTCPLITEKTQAAWQLYALQNQWWIREFMDRQAGLGLDALQNVEWWIREFMDRQAAVSSEGGSLSEEAHGGNSRDLLSLWRQAKAVDNSTSTTPEEQEVPPEMLFPSPVVVDIVNGSIAMVTGVGPRFPVWQSFPLLNFAINRDLHKSHEARTGFDIVLETNDAVLDKFLDASDPTSFLTKIAAASSTAANRTYNGEPVSLGFYPIFDGFSPSRKLVGALVELIFWPVFFSNILPECDYGFIVVLEDGCNQTFTMEVNGPSVDFLGDGDRHNSRYDSFFMHLDFATEGLVGARGASLTNVSFNDEHCHYSIRVYPSQTIEDVYITKQPLIIASFGALIFVVTALLFLFYDWYVV